MGSRHELLGFVAAAEDIFLMLSLDVPELKVQMETATSKCFAQVGQVMNSALTMHERSQLRKQMILLG